MEWLIAHMDDVDDNSVPPETEKPMQETAETEINTPSTASSDDQDRTMINEENLSQEAKSIKCDECGRKFRTDAEIEFHAVKTGHQSFSQSTEEIKPMTEEQRQEQIRKVESIIKQRRAEKAEQEKKEALEREKNRRKSGQELTHARQRIEEEEIRRLAEAKRKEKIEAKLARQRVLEEIERDKQARREKFGMGGGSATTTSTPAETIPTPQSQPVQTKKDYDHCKLQIRLTNGQCLVHTFGSNEELAAVRLYIELNRSDGSGPFSLMTNFPKKVFSEEDMNCPLNSLGLVPSAVLIVSKSQ